MKIKIVFKNRNSGDITLKVNGKEVNVEKDFYDYDSITILYNPKNFYEITNTDKNISFVGQTKKSFE